MTGCFAGKRVFVTGAASGIGRATALRLAREGAELYLTDVNAEGLEQTVADARALGADVPEHCALDISDYDAVARLAADIHTHYPAMGIVMNVIQTFLPPMVAARRGGQLVNVSSAAGLVALPWHAAYSPSKFGLHGLSEVLRFDLARHDIGVS
jgi:NAD(P)-dependent dehydrogenase (short-subunit alcohol dehydrogenase family)